MSVCLSHPLQAAFHNVTFWDSEQGPQVIPMTTGYNGRRWSVMRKTWVKHQRPKLADGALGAYCIVEAVKGDFSGSSAPCW